MNIYDLDSINSIPKGSYAVIGYPIEHSLSPDIHNALTKNNNYYCISLKPEELKKALPILRKKLKGFNCTIPHKLSIMQHLDYIDESATEYGAVNTVKVEGNRLYGYNTDGKGFLSAIKRAGMNLGNKSILLCGAGGVARVMAFECVKKGAHLTIYNRSKQRAIDLMKAIKLQYHDSRIDVIDIVVNVKWDYLLNATPQGMYPKVNDIPIDPVLVPNFKGVYDTIYNPLETKLIKLAKEHNITADNGLYMLIMQAIHARVIWEGYGSSENIIGNIYNMLVTYLTIR